MPQSADQFSGIFICYRREDSGGHAGRLYDRLIARFGEEQIFMDVDYIEPGEDFVQVIENAVGSCEILIALIGQVWLAGRNGARRLDNSNDFVRLEIAVALARGVSVIPVLVQRAQMPSGQDLPEDLLPLARRNAYELSDQRWNHDVARLIDALEKILVRRREARRIAAQQEAERQRPKEEEQRQAQESERLEQVAEAERQRRETKEAERRRQEAEDAARTQTVEQPSVETLETPAGNSPDTMDKVSSFLNWLGNHNALEAAFIVFVIVIVGIGALLLGRTTDINPPLDNANSARGVTVSTPALQPTPTTGTTTTPTPSMTMETTATPSPTSTARPSPTQDDAALQAKVDKALADDQQISSSQISATVLNGRVRLTGTVDSEDIKRRAERVAYSVKGVLGVSNEIVLTARTPIPTPSQAPSPERPTNSNSYRSGTVTLDIDPTTGLIAAPTCPVVRTKTFAIGTEPHRRCGPQYHQNQTIVPNETRPRKVPP